MRKNNPVFKQSRTVLPFLALLLIVYLIANACAGGYNSYATAGGWSGILWVDSIPGPSGMLHIHAHCTKPDRDATDTLPMIEDSIPLSFSQWQSHSRINGTDYDGKYYSSYGTVHSIYAAGTWTIDSAYVDNDSGGAWEGKIVTVLSLLLPTPTYEGDTLDFTR
ncbi:MAG TPA: hypothetical protein VFH95_13485 [Candidatus Kapabacteria bacterium]|nr:hypothetical protein [Candidatus Kapabacteria bacterium]